MRNGTQDAFYCIHNLWVVELIALVPLFLCLAY